MWGQGTAAGLPRAGRGPLHLSGGLGYQVMGAPGGSAWVMLIKRTVPTCASVCVCASYFNEKVGLKYTGTSTLEDKLGRKGGGSATSGGF